MKIIRRSGQRGCVIGIDQSYTGFALCTYYRDGTYEVHRQGFPADKVHGVDRLVAIGVWLRLVLMGIPGDAIEHVCMEDYAPNSKFGREMAGELGAVVKLALRTNSRCVSPVCYPTIVAVTSLKKFTCGTGAAKKSSMMLACYKQWGAEFKDDDSADSYALARIAAAIQWGATDLPVYQQDVLEKLRQHTEL